MAEIALGPDGLRMIRPRGRRPGLPRSTQTTGRHLPPGPPPGMRWPFAGRSSACPGGSVPGPAAGRGELSPVCDGRADQARAVMATPGPQQQRMTPPCPQQVSGSLLKAGRAAAQPARANPVAHPPAMPPAARPQPPWPHDRANPQASPPGLPPGSLASSWPSAWPPARWKAGRPDPERARPPRPAPDRQAACAIRGKKPECSRGRRRLLRESRGRREARPTTAATGRPREVTAARPAQPRSSRSPTPLTAMRLCLRQLLPPAQEITPVVLAGQRRRCDHLAGLGERQRLTVKSLDEVNRADALIRVGRETAPQVTQGFAGIESPDRAAREPGARPQERRNPRS